MLLKVSDPSTVWVRFINSPFPKYFCLYDDKGRIYYFRYLDGNTGIIKFNIPNPGEYTPDTAITLFKSSHIETPKQYPTLPKPERSRWKEPSFVYNPDLEGTPCRIFTETGVIEHGPAYFTYPPPIRLFLDLHETGHFFYKTEEYCDLWALVNFLRMGFNRSTAYYVLDKVLSRTQENLDRLKYLLTQITVNGDQFKPY